MDLTRAVQYLSTVEQTGVFATLHLFYMTSHNSLVKHLRRLNRARGVNEPVMDFLDEHLIGCNPAELGLNAERIQAHKTFLMQDPRTRDVFIGLHAAWMCDLDLLKMQCQQSARSVEARRLGLHA